MASKITLIRSTAEPLGNSNRQALYWYTINPAVLDAAVPPNTVIVQASSTLDRSPDVLRYITAADRSALDAGQAGYEILSRLQTAGETNLQYRNRLLAEHALREAAWVADRRAEYASAGTTAN